MEVCQFSPVDRKYRIFEVSDADEVLFDVSKNDSGINRNLLPSLDLRKDLDLSPFESFLKEVFELAAQSVEV